MSQLDYVCVYLNWLQTHPVPDSFYDLFESRDPEYTVRINGIEYLWLYKLNKADYLSLPADAVRADADYANGLHLVGYRTFEADPDSGDGWLVPLQIFWQVEHPCIKDHRWSYGWSTTRATSATPGRITRRGARTTARNRRAPGAAI